jgi:hypothetical protein
MERSAGLRERCRNETTRRAAFEHIPRMLHDPTREYVRGGRGGKKAHYGCSVASEHRPILVWIGYYYSRMRLTDLANVRSVAADKLCICVKQTQACGEDATYANELVQ